MKKRIVSMLLAGTMVFSLAGCGEMKMTNLIQNKTNSERTQVNSEINAGGLQAEGEIVQTETKKNDVAFDSNYLQFAFEALKASEHTGENIMISPLSIITALSMTANGADNETLKQMEEVLYNGGSLEEILPELLYYIKSLPSSEETHLQQANSIWVKDDGSLHVNNDFLQKNAGSFGSEIYQREFDEETKEAINKWVETNTSGMIKDILNEMDPNAVMYLINAIAFEAEWQEKYEEYQILENQIFTREDGTQEGVTMLYSSESGYLEDENTIGFVKPYKDGYSFVALLPKEGVTMQDYLATLSAEKWSTLFKCIDYTPVVQAKIPEFTSEYSTEMSAVLSAMGMPDAFDPLQADFHKMASSDNGNISINRVIHKTYIALDRNGTKAAAATVVEMVDECAAIEDPKEYKQIYLDRPFVYAIIDNESRLPIFVGAAEQIN